MDATKQVTFETQANGRVDVFVDGVKRGSVSKREGRGWFAAKDGAGMVTQDRAVRFAKKGMFERSSRSKVFPSKAAAVAAVVAD